MSTALLIVGLNRACTRAIRGITSYEGSGVSTRAIGAGAQAVTVHAQTLPDQRTVKLNVLTEEDGRGMPV